MSSVIGNASTQRMTFQCAASAKTTTSQFKLAYLTQSMTVGVPSAAGELIIGIIDSMQSAGSEYCSVITRGLARGTMLAATTVAAVGDYLIDSGDGYLITAHDAGNTWTTAQVVVGRSLTVPATGGAVLLIVNPVDTATH